jgi:hypothetical protein
MGMPSSLVKSLSNVPWKPLIAELSTRFGTSLRHIKREMAPPFVARDRRLP